MLRFGFLTMMVGLLAVLPQSALAQFLAGNYTQVITDPSNDAFNDGGDEWYEITGVYFGYDVSNYYFRIDLNGAPTAGDTLTFDEFAIYIDADTDDATGGDGSGSNYVPDPFNGIEYILDLHWDNGGQNWGADHFHTNTTGNAYDTDASALTVQTSENGGKSIELGLAKTELPSGPWTVYAGTNDSVNGDTSDITAGAQVPEPATLGLLGAGGLAMLFRRRRR